MSQRIRLTFREALSCYDSTRLVTLPGGQEPVTIARLSGLLTKEEADMSIYWQGEEQKGIGLYQAEGDQADRLLCWVHWSRPTEGGQA